jgi:ankyrin repeat protein
LLPFINPECRYEPTIEDRALYSAEQFKGMTPLILSARFNNETIIKYLIFTKKVSLNTHVKGRTALIEAIDQQNKSIAQLLLDKGASVEIAPMELNTLYYIILTKNIDMMNWLLKERISLIWQGSPLLYALSRYSHENSDINTTNILLKILIAAGADVNETSQSDRTSLLFAAKKGRKEIVKMILKHGALSTSRIDDNSISPITHAIENGHISIAEYLLPS